jgi:hypothetical protein
MDLKDINMELIFNKLTEKGICKFISLYDIDGKIACNKEALKKLVRESMGEDTLFESIPMEKFIQYYQNTEEAGQKNFYFYHLEINDTILENIEHFKSLHTNEDERKFNTAQDNEWFYREKNDEITCKQISIKQVYQYDNTLNKPIENGIFYKAYHVKTIQNILFIRFYLKINKVVIGIDKYSDLDTYTDIKKKVIDSFELICGKDSHLQLENLLDNDTIENLLNVPNAISTNIRNEINQHKKSAMFAKHADLSKILNDLDNGVYSLEHVKSKNPDFDIKAHPTYIAEQSKIYDDDLQVDIENTQIYWFTHQYKKSDYFRIKINTVDSSITTYSPSISKEEFDNVVLQVI